MRHASNQQLLPRPGALFPLPTHPAVCWNGPARSIALKFECGGTDALLSVDEPNKCAYEARVTTPAACDGRAARELQLHELEPEL